MVVSSSDSYGKVSAIYGERRACRNTIFKFSSSTNHIHICGLRTAPFFFGVYGNAYIRIMSNIRHFPSEAVLKKLNQGVVELVKPLKPLHNRYFN